MEEKSMKIDWSLVLVVIFGIAATICTWSADLFLDDVQLYVDIKIGSAYFLIAMVFVCFDSFNKNRKKQIAELKKEVEELRNSMVQ